MKEKRRLEKEGGQGVVGSEGGDGEDSDSESGKDDDLFGDDPADDMEIG